MAINFDVLGFPIVNEGILFEIKLDEKMQQASDKEKFLEGVRRLKNGLNNREINAAKFNERQLQQIQDESPAISGLRWHFHQVKGKLQLVRIEYHDAVIHVGGRELWGGGI